MREELKASKANVKELENMQQKAKSTSDDTLSTVWN